MSESRCRGHQRLKAAANVLMVVAPRRHCVETRKFIAQTYCNECHHVSIPTCRSQRRQVRTTPLRTVWTRTAVKGSACKAALKLFMHTHAACFSHQSQRGWESTAAHCGFPVPNPCLPPNIEVGRYRYLHVLYTLPCKHCAGNVLAPHPSYCIALQACTTHD